jgi:hypothetical protein
VTHPLFWLVLSLLFVTFSLTVMLLVAIPTLKELARAARSAEKLFDTLRREFPPTLEAIRLTSLEITDLTDDLTEGVQSAGNVIKQVDQSLSGARQKTHKVRSGTRSLFTGLRTAWKTFTRSPAQRRAVDRLPPARLDGEVVEFDRDRPEFSPSQPELAHPDYHVSHLAQEPRLPQSFEETNGSRFISKDGELIEQPQILPAEADASPDPQAANRGKQANPPEQTITPAEWES